GFGGSVPRPPSAVSRLPSLVARRPSPARSPLAFARRELAVLLAGPAFHAVLFSLAALASFALVLRYVQVVPFVASLLSGEPWRDVFRLQLLLWISAAALAGPLTGASLFARDRPGLPHAFLRLAPLPPLAVFSGVFLAGLAAVLLLLAALLPPVLACRALGGPDWRDLAALSLGAGALGFFGLAAGALWAVFLHRLARACFAACLTTLPAAFLVLSAGPAEFLIASGLAAAAGAALLVPAALVWRLGNAKDP
ncbi:MAG: hypothetical protein HY720_22880, partial [Planctomycetes bacterium]|nr:hypothetical protein [Planctomycetota bacterium]